MSFVKFLLSSFYFLITVIFLSELSLRYIYTPKALELRIDSNRIARDPRQSQALFDGNNLNFFPNSSGRIIHAEYDVEANHDKIGFRNPCFEFEDKVYRIIIGDSFLYGVGVPDKETFSCNLNKISNVKKYYTIGVPGANPRSYLQILNKNNEILKKNLMGKPSVSIMIFMGNDYEELLSIDNDVLDINLDVSPLSLKEKFQFKNIVFYFNSLLVKSPILSESYFFNSIKIIYLNLTKKSDNEFYFRSNSGNTFYKFSSSSDNTDLKKSIQNFVNIIQNLGFPIGEFYLIPHPSDISINKLTRDSKLSQFSIEKVNINYKYEMIIKTCKEIKLRCIDLRNNLSEKDFYEFDDHLRPSGVKIAAKNILKLKLSN